MISKLPSALLAKGSAFQAIVYPFRDDDLSVYLSLFK